MDDLTPIVKSLLGVGLPIVPPDETHRCSEMAEAERTRAVLEEGDPSRPELLWGRAITRIDRSGKFWVAHNDEYSCVPIHFCPWCGIRLPVPEL